MNVECDRCGRELEQEKAIRRVVEDEEYFFCSPQCMESSELLDPAADPEREDKKAPPAEGAAEN